MARGYPDFFGQSIFLNYGGAQESASIVNVPTGVITTIQEIIGKGILYNITLFTQDTDALITDLVSCYVNNVRTSHFDWVGMLLLGRYSPMLAEFSPTAYNIESSRFSAILMGPFSFDTAVSLTYHTLSVPAVTVYGCITYSLVA